MAEENGASAPSDGAQAVSGKFGGLILTQSKLLRMATLFLFYFTQGFPVGVFFYAIPAWMAANGASAGEVAGVVGVSALPWSLKLVNGFILDRYTYLPMGRRRAWIITAQCAIVLAFLAGAVIAPPSSEVFMLSAFGFAANMAVTVQDVGIDSLAVDIMPEDERAKAGGIMFGAQALGIAAATGMVGYLLDVYGISVALIVAAFIPAAVAVYGMMIREREGEKRLPWSSGKAHKRNVDIQVEAWWPLLVNGFKAVTVPLSLLLIPVLLLRAVPDGASEVFHPVLAQQIAGWSLTEYTGFLSTAQMIAGVSGLLVGGWLIDAMGAQRSMLIFWVFSMVTFAAMALAGQYWTETWFLTSFFITREVTATFLAIAMIPIAMRMCSPAVAATQFTIYMAVGNFGRPLGAWIAAHTTDTGSEALLYWALTGLWVVGLAILIFARFPTDDRADASGDGADEAEDHVLGEGLSASVD